MACNEGINGVFPGMTDDHTQDWALDAAGNWSGVTTDGTAQSRTHDAQNRLTAMGPDTLDYDADGNLTAELSIGYTYDA